MSYNKDGAIKPKRKRGRPRKNPLPITTTGYVATYLTETDNQHNQRNKEKNKE